jgi:hypothetical protein
MRKLIIAGLAAVALTGAAGAASGQPVVVERYGHWDSGWGAAPPPPRAAWHQWRGHEGNWYGHVHSCAVKYRNYDPHRDMYRAGKRWVACRD